MQWQLKPELEMVLEDTNPIWSQSRSRSPGVHVPVGATAE